MTRRFRIGPLLAGLGVLMMVLAIGAVAPQPGSVDGVAQAGAASPGDGMIPPGDWTSDQRAEMLDLIERTERDLPAFSDPAYLRSIGFHDFGVTAPGGYVHYINPDWMDDGHVLDPKYPESLLFQQVYDPDSGTSTMKLVAAMFFAKTGTSMDTIPSDISWIPGWHVHPDLCTTDDFRFAGFANSDGTCSVGHPQHLPMTHVWITDNGCGHRFAMVGVGGLMCDMHMHDDHDGTTTTTMPAGSTTTVPSGSTTSVPSAASVVPPTSTRSSELGAVAAEPAAPVTGSPTYTG